VDRVCSIDPKYPIWKCVQRYGICPMGIVTSLSVELWRLYNALGGTSRISTPEEYYRLPAIYVDAVRIIERELTEIKAYAEA